MRKQFGEIFVERTRADWCALLEGTDVCFGPVLSPEEAANHPDMQARNVYCERDGRLEARPTMRPLELVIPEAAQHLRDPLMTFAGAGSRSKVERMCAVEDGAHLVQRADLRFVHLDDHPR
ncbi:CoA transferase [Paraburkholderia sp. J63]|uniref:CoA transferase n=1 Tax=Paraburkholderia sp. J63 TaxID=2805434 RepID=UPI002ABE87F6|nr:CoA transferase [Paraburkholderia sp. J63]